MDLKELEEFLKSNPLSSHHPRVSNPVRSDSPSISLPQSTNFQNLQSENTSLKDQIKFLQEQCNFARNETKRIQDQYSIDKENWSLEIQHLKKLLIKNSNEDSSKTELKKLKQLNKDLQTKNDQLTSELLQAKKEFDQMKTAANKKTLALEAQIERLKKREGEVLRKMEEKSKNLNSGSGSVVAGKGFEKKEKGEKVRRAKAVEGADDDRVRSAIDSLEKEIQELSGRYKEMVFGTGSKDISTVAEGLARVTQELEIKNKELVDLKKVHQAHIRESLKKLDL